MQNQTKIPLKTTLGLNLNQIENQFGHKFQKTIMLISFTQALFAIIRYGLKIFIHSKKTQPTESPIQVISSIINYDESLVFTKSDSITTISMIIVFSLLAIRIAIYIIFGAFAKNTQKLFTKLMFPIALLTNLHTHIFSFSFNNVFLRCIEEYSEGRLYLFSSSSTGQKNNNLILVIFSIFIVIINSMGTILPILKLSTRIKTENLWSSKDSLCMTLLLLFKIVFPIMVINFSGNNGQQTNQLLIVMVSIIFSFWQIAALLYYIPFYHVQGQKLWLTGSSILAAFSLSLLVTKQIQEARLNSSYNENPFTLFIVLSIVLSLLLHIVCQSILQKRLLAVFNSQISKKTHVELCLSYGEINRYLNKRGQIPREDHDKHDFNYLLSIRDLKNISRDDEFLIDRQINRNVNNRILNYYEKFAKKFPKSLDVKLNHLVELFNQGTGSLRAFDELNRISAKQSSLGVQVSVEIIRKKATKVMEDQFVKKEKVQTDSANGEIQESIDIACFSSVEKVFSEFKNLIIKQISLQMEFWQQFSLKSFQFQNLLSINNKIFQKRLNIYEVWENFDFTRKGSFLKPLAVYGVYQQIANYDIVEGQSLFKKYNELSSLDTSHVNKFSGLEGLFNKDNYFIKISAALQNIGIVLDASHNLHEFIGIKRSELLGKNVNLLQSDYIASRHNFALKGRYNTGKYKFSGQILIIPLKGAHGYIIPTLYQVKLNTDISENINYLSLLRTVKSSSRMVLVKDDGFIDGYCEQFAIDFELDELEKKISSEKSKMRMNDDCTNNLYQKSLLQNLRIEEFSWELSLVASSFYSANKIQEKQKLGEDLTQDEKDDIQRVDQFEAGDKRFSLFNDQYSIAYEAKIILFPIHMDHILILLLDPIDQEKWDKRGSIKCRRIYQNPQIVSQRRSVLQKIRSLQHNQTPKSTRRDTIQNDQIFQSSEFLQLSTNRQQITNRTENEHLITRVKEQFQTTEATEFLNQGSKQNNFKIPIQPQGESEFQIEESLFSNSSETSESSEDSSKIQVRKIVVNPHDSHHSQNSINFQKGKKHNKKKTQIFEGSVNSTVQPNSIQLNSMFNDFANKNFVNKNQRLLKIISIFIFIYWLFCLLLQGLQYKNLATLFLSQMQLSVILSSFTSEFMVYHTRQFVIVLLKRGQFQLTGNITIDSLFFYDQGYKEIDKLLAKINDLQIRMGHREIF